MSDPQNVVFEEILRRAMDEALALKAKESLTDEERGELNAYLNILDWGKQQAEALGVEFDDEELKAFDPYSLILKKAA